MEPSKKPLNLLIKQTDSYVSVILKNGTEYRGTMVRCDGYMNILLNGATEYHGGQIVANFGSVLVRGNNILYITFGVLPKS